MLLAPAGGCRGDFARSIDRRPFQSAVGVKMMVPGWAHLSWGQRQRGWILVGSFAAAILVGLWAWGTWVGWGLFAFAFLTHVTSATDVLRQASFPTYPSRMALLIFAGALAFILYLPTLFFLSVIAKPGFEADGAGSGFLVNCWAYQDGSEPREGQWVWMRYPLLEKPHAGRVVATSGQEVEWNGRQWRVNGHDCLAHSVLRLDAWPQACRFIVPSHQILVEPDDDAASAPNLGPLVLVSPDRIIGRAWAHFYPVWDRHLL
jgi:hypothetical protein